MNPFDYLPIVAEQQHDELLKHSAESRMLSEAFPSKKPIARRRSRFWVKVREECYYLVYSLQARFSDQNEVRMPINQPSNSEGCA